MVAEKGLTAKQQAFVWEYLVDLNATQAATRAGYSARTAEIIGHENLRKPRIAEAIAAAFQARAKRTNITADRVLEEYAKIAMADIRDFLAFRTEKTVVDRDDDGEPIIDYRLVVDIKDSSEVDGTMINEISIAKDGTFKFKLHDKKGALDAIAKHLGMFVERHELTGKDGKPIQFEHTILPASEVDRRLAELAEPIEPTEKD